MLQLRNRAALARALDQPIDPHLRALLAQRAAQIDHAWFAVIEPGDGIPAVEAELRFPLTDQGVPCFDWIMSHPGGWYEVLFDFGDLAHVLFVPDRDGANPDLLALCRAPSSHHAASDPTTQA